jgi:phosphatidylglycerophosphatase A
MTGITVSCDLSRVWGKDPHQIVIDEYASLLIPLYFTPRRIIPLIITVIVFRVFDILKPPPIKQLEKLPSGWGIMSDDLGAAVLTAVVIIILIHVIPL